MGNMDTVTNEIEKPSLDHFFFSCLSYENLVKSNRKSLVTPGIIHTKPSENLKVLVPLDKSTLSQIFSAIEKENTVYAEAKFINFENLPDVNQALVSICENINEIGKSVLKNSDQNSIKQFCDAIKNEFFGRFDSQSKELIHSFMFWAFKKTDLVPEVIGDRPPVGAFTPSRNFKPTQDRDRAPRRSESKVERPFHKGPKGRKPDRQDRDRPPRESRGNGRSETSEADLLKEIIEATSKIKAASDTDRVALKPQNSYNRRRQHKLIEDEGFTSSSEGEGDQRHVVVLKA